MSVITLIERNIKKGGRKDEKTKHAPNRTRGFCRSRGTLKGRERGASWAVAWGMEFYYQGGIVVLVPSEEFVVSQKRLTKPVNRLQIQALRHLLNIWWQPQIYQKILEGCQKSKAKHSIVNLIKSIIRSNQVWYFLLGGMTFLLLLCFNKDFRRESEFLPKKARKKLLAFIFSKIRFWSEFLGQGRTSQKSQKN